MAVDDIRLGVLLPTGRAQWGDGTDPRELIDFAVRAERLGYDSLWVIAGTPAELAARLRPYLAAGARHLVCRIAALDLAAQRDQLERITELAQLVERKAPA